MTNQRKRLRTAEGGAALAVGQKLLSGMESDTYRDDGSRDSDSDDDSNCLVELQPAANFAAVAVGAESAATASNDDDDDDDDDDDSVFSDIVSISSGSSNGIVVRGGSGSSGATIL